MPAQHRSRTLVVAIALALLAAPAGAHASQGFVGVTADGKVATFTAAVAPGLTSLRPLKGVVRGARILALDRTPRGAVLALDAAGRIFDLDPGTGALTPRFGARPVAGRVGGSRAVTFSVAPDGRSVLVDAGGKARHISLATGEASPASSAGAAVAADTLADGRLVGYDAGARAWRPIQAVAALGDEPDPTARPKVIVRLPRAIARTRLLGERGLRVMVHTDRAAQVTVGVQDAGRRERGFTIGATDAPGWMRLKVNLRRPRTWAVGERIHVHVAVHAFYDTAHDPGRLVDRWVHVAGATGSPPQVRFHAIFGGHGVHVGQVLDVAPSQGKMTQLCWDPAPIDRPACSRSAFGAPSVVGQTRLIVRLADGSLLSRVIRVAPAYTRIGGHGGSDAVPGHVGCAALTLYMNPGPLRGEITTLPSNAAIAIYNRVRDARFVWHYADNKAGFADPRCARPGLPKPPGAGGA